MEDQSKLRDRISELTDQAGILSRKNTRLASALRAAQQELAAVHEQIDLLQRTPLNYGIVLSVQAMARTADISLAGRKTRVTVADSVVASALKIGQEVRLNEHLVITAADQVPQVGELLTVKEVRDNHALVQVRQDEERLLLLSDQLQQSLPRVGDCLVCDLRAGLALRQIERAEVQDLLLEEIPNVSYQDIGALEEQITQIREAVEIPFAHPELYQEHGLRAPRGILLYGPPGCGKTLIAKAIATALGQAQDREADHPSPAYFLNIKGPQLLDKYVGETERQIRLIFARARQQAAAGKPVVVFFDEMESLFRTRGSGKSSDVETTVVPQLLSEIDGVEALDNVIIIGATNREDMLDPAIVRPGRLDVKIRVDRPNRVGAAQILSIYLTDKVPLVPQQVTAFGSRKALLERLIEVTVATVFDRTPQTALTRVLLSDGSEETLYLADLVSGAMLVNIVSRAKRSAINDYLKTQVKGVTEAHLQAAVLAEAAQTRELSASATPREWLRTLGDRGLYVSQLLPILETSQ